jgi:hypothetical protein
MSGFVLRVLLHLCTTCALTVLYTCFDSIAIPTSTLLTWAAVMIRGMDNVGFYLLFFLCCSYYLYCLPLASSFKPGSHRRLPGTSALTMLFHATTASTDSALNGTDSAICGKIESMLHCSAVVGLPALAHIALYRRVLFSSFEHISSLLLLISLALLYLRVLSYKHSLHWLGMLLRTKRCAAREHVPSGVSRISDWRLGDLQP